MAEPEPITQRMLKRLSASKAIILVATLLAASAFTFIEVAGEVSEGETLHLDNTILHALRNPTDPSIPIGPSWLLPGVQDISALGGVAVLIAFTLAVSGFCWFDRKKKLLLFFLGSVGGGTMAMVLLKHFFARPRPSIVPHLVPVAMESFPSGHSMIAAIFYLTLGALLAQATQDRVLKIYYYAIACLITLLIGISRVYLGVHYPTDVLAGWCAGIAWSATTYLISEWLQRRGKLEEGDEIKQIEQTE